MNTDRIIIISNPVPATNESSLLSLQKFVNVISGVYEKEIILISGNIPEDRFSNDHVLRVIPLTRKRYANKIRSVLSFFWFQMKAGLAALRYIKKNDKVFFWIGDGMIFPFSVARMRRAEIFYYIYGNPEKISCKGTSEKNTAKRIAGFANHADWVCAENGSVFNEWGSTITNQRRKTVHLYTEPQPISECRDRIVGMLCRISEGKYVMESIRAFETISETFPEWRLEIVGSGTLFHECEQYIEQNGLTDRVKLYGWMDSQEKWKVMRRWQYLLFPTDTEGLPNTLLESMSLGIPPICSPVSSLTELVRDQATGFYIHENSVEGIASALGLALSRTEDYDRFCERNVQMIEQEYTFQKAVESARQELAYGN